MKESRKYLYILAGLVALVFTFATAPAMASSPGDVLTSWSATGAILPWGVGYFDGNVWISDPSSASLLNIEYDTSGTPTGRSWATTFGGSWAGDMAYDPTNDWMWQVNVGGDNGIYAWDPDTGTVTASITGSFAWTNTSQRGLAYRPDNDTFYIGGWNEGIIYNIYGLSYGVNAGGAISSFYPADYAISGLAWDPAGILWESTNSSTDTIYALNPSNGQVLLSFAHPNPYYKGAGLEINEDRNLWTVDQTGGMAYLLYTGSPNPPSVPEPGTLLLLGLGITGLALLRRKS